MSTPGVNHRNYLDIAPNKPFAAIWTSEGFIPEFPGEAICGIFPGTAKNIFPESAKSGETSFYPLETKKRTLVAKNVIGKCQNSKSKGSCWPSQTPPTRMNTGHYLWGKETVKRFADVHFHCIVSTLKNISKMSMLPAPWKISADAHASDIVVSPDILRWF